MKGTCTIGQLESCKIYRLIYLKINLFNSSIITLQERKYLAKGLNINNYHVQNMQSPVHGQFWATQLTSLAGLFSLSLRTMISVVD